MTDIDRLGQLKRAIPGAKHDPEFLEGCIEGGLSVPDARKQWKGRTKAATLAELREALPSSNAEFRIDCVEEGLLLDEAKMRWGSTRYQHRPECVSVSP